MYLFILNLTLYSTVVNIIRSCDVWVKIIHMFHNDEYYVNNWAVCHVTEDQIKMTTTSCIFHGVTIAVIE